MSSKLLILGSLLTLAMSANAQEQTATTSASASTIESDAATAAAQGSVSTTVKAQKVFSVNLSTENSSMLRDQNTLHSGAPVSSMEAVGLAYNFGNSQIELRQYMNYAFNKENMSADELAAHPNDLEQSYLMPRFATKWETAALGSKTINAEFRYYAPTDRASKEAKSNGTLRADVYTDWNLTPAWNFTAILSPRVRLNSVENTDAAVGADAAYYAMLASGYMTYNFNDSFGLYYGLTQNQRSHEAQRGHWSNDVKNEAIHEIGVNWTIGPVTINPVLESDLDQNGAQASIFTENSRFFADDTTSVNLNVYATF